MQIVETVLQWASVSPDRVAVESSSGSLTYAGLADDSARWRDALAASGVRPGDVVVLDLPRGPAAVAAMLGTLRVGAAYTVIRSDHPAERRRRMIASVAASCEADESFLSAHRGSPQVPDHVRDRNDIMYVVFTSGTTSEPKAVDVPDRGVLRLATEPRLGLTSGGRIGHLAAIEFDASVFEIWGGLLTGMTLVTASPSEVVNARYLLTQVVPTLDVLWLTSSLFNFLVDKDAGAFAALERVVVGGEALSLHHVNAVLPHTIVVNGYGPTENTVFTTLDVMTEPVEEILIGLPVPRTDIRIVDSAGRSSDAGELVVLGDGVALGYRNRPGDAAFAELDGRPAYRTGDHVRRRPSGRLAYGGRIDAQVKVNGYRVDLGEVEAAFVAAGARTCKAFVVDGVLAAAVTPDTAVPRSTTDALLPVYMRPRRVLTLDALPLTPNGKTDVEALVALGRRPTAARPGPDAGRGPGPDSGSVPVPVSVPVGTVRAVAASVLGRPVPQDVDDLFEFGLDSIGVWRLVATVNDRAGVEIPFFSVLTDPSIDRLEAAVASFPDRPAAQPLAAHDARPAQPTQVRNDT
jgi:acyl-coenzyme A synthetase/AMP-(fatty) acid ligase/aryl carrier-like protein